MVLSQHKDEEVTHHTEVDDDGRDEHKAEVEMRLGNLKAIRGQYLNPRDTKCN